MNLYRFNFKRSYLRIAAGRPLAWARYAMRCITSVLFVSALALPIAANAAINCNSALRYDIPAPGSISSLPRDIAFGTPLSSWFSAGNKRTFDSCSSSDPATSSLQASSALPSTNRTIYFSGETYTVYKTNVRGVGIIISAADS